MKNQIKDLEILSVLYAVFFTFCLYHNSKGITFPFFVAGTLCYFYLCMKKSGKELNVYKKGDLFYIISLFLLGISVFLTNDLRVLFITKFFIFILFTLFLLHHYYDDSKWIFTKYLQSIIEAVVYAIGSIGSPITDLIAFFQERKNSLSEKKDESNLKEETKVKSILLGIVITIPLLFIVVFMLASADLVFRSYCTNFFRIIKFGTIISILFMTIVGYFVSYSIIHSLNKKEIKEDCTPIKEKEPVLAITVTSVISLVYLLFCGIQIFYLFLGNMELPENYTYAEYAHQGFYQLLFICLLNMVLVLICVTIFKESRILKFLLCIICICTYIMTASSAYRMYLYVNVYYFTFLRLMVFFLLSLISVIMLGIMITIMKKNFHLFRYCMVTVTVFAIILSYSHPDYIIAKYNIKNAISLNSSNNTNNSFTDIPYLTSLSEDATPILLDVTNFEKLYYISPQDMNNYLMNCRDKTSNNKLNIRNFNVSSYLHNKYTNDFRYTFL